MSPASNSDDKSLIELSTTPAGTISQMARGLFSFLTKSESDLAPTALSLARPFTASAERSKTTH